MMKRASNLFTSGLLLFAATACGDSGDGANGDLCGIPGATAVTEPRNYPDDSVIIRMTARGGALYFGTFDEIYGVATPGAEPALVYPPTPATLIYPPFWFVGTDLVVGLVDELDVLAETGGAVLETRTLTTPYSANLDGSVDIVLGPDGHTFYAKHDPIVLSGETPSIDYWKYDFATDTLTPLLSDSSIGHHKAIVVAGDHLYTADPQGMLGDPNAPSDLLYRIPLEGGAAEAVPVTGGFKMQLVGADATHLYFAGRPTPFDVTSDMGGFYRLPLDGGAPERVIEQYITTTAVSEFVRLSDRAIVWYLDRVFEIPLDGGEGRELFVTDCELHAMTATETDLYVSTYEDTGSTAQILRVPLP